VYIFEYNGINKQKMTHVSLQYLRVHRNLNRTIQHIIIHLHKQILQYEIDEAIHHKKKHTLSFKYYAQVKLLLFSLDTQVHKRSRNDDEFNGSYV